MRRSRRGIASLSCTSTEEKILRAGLSPRSAHGIRATERQDRPTEAGSAILQSRSCPTGDSTVARSDAGRGDAQRADVLGSARTCDVAACLRQLPAETPADAELQRRGLTGLDADARWRCTARTARPGHCPGAAAQVLLLIGSNRTEGRPFAQLLYYANKLNPAKRLRGARKTHVCRAGTGPGAVCAHGGAVAQSRWRAPANLLQIVQIQSHIADPPAPPDAGPAAAYPRADVRLRSSTTRVRHSVYCG